MSAADQDKYFNDANECVRRNSFFMQDALEKNDLNEAIKYAHSMINELRTAKLYPTRYYELYMNVTNQLAYLEHYFKSEYEAKLKKDKPSATEWLSNWYDRVQFCGNIVPRLYLLITIGSVVLKAHKDEKEEVMRIIFDMVGLTKGVQHPTRGLFLRNYLSQVCRFVLPDINADEISGLSTAGAAAVNEADEKEENDGGDGLDLSAAKVSPHAPGISGVHIKLEEYPFVKQSIDFILQNFAEMTRLWVRMQHQGAVRDRSRREKERLQLRMLVGTNLRRLSELSAVTLNVYSEYVLPSISEQIIKCKDKIAQDYLMECLIMVFSDEYHLCTLSDFLQIVNKLHSSVHVNSIIIKLMDRLSKYAELAPENRYSFDSRDVFTIFQTKCKDIITKHKKISVDDILALYVELVNFASCVYPSRYEYIGTMIDESLAVITDKSKGQLAPGCIPHVCRMLVSPLRSMQLKALEIDSYCRMIEFLSKDDRKKVACDMVTQLVNQNNEGVYLSNPDLIRKLFPMIEPLLIDDESSSSSAASKTAGSSDDSDDSNDDEDGGEYTRNAGQSEQKMTEEELEQFEQDQELVAKLVHLIRNDTSVDIHYETLHLAAKSMSKGGDLRLVYTFPPLIFNALSLIQRVNNLSEEELSEVTIKRKKMFQFVFKLTDSFAQHRPEEGVRLWLYAGLAADKSDLKDIAYEFMSQSMICFEEYLSDTNEQFSALTVMIGYLQQLQNMEEDNFDNLRNKCAQHSSRLLKKDLSAKSLSLSSHLYWNCLFKDGERTAKCLSRAGKKANSMMDSVQKVEIFVSILNKYVYFLYEHCSEIEVDKITQLIALVKELLSDSDYADEPGFNDVKKYFRLTCQHISDVAEGEKDSLPEVAALFKSIEL